MKDKELVRVEETNKTHESDEINKVDVFNYSSDLNEEEQDDDEDEFDNTNTDDDNSADESSSTTEHNEPQQTSELVEFKEQTGSDSESNTNEGAYDAEFWESYNEDDAAKIEELLNTKNAPFIAQCLQLKAKDTFSTLFDCLYLVAKHICFCLIIVGKPSMGKTYVATRILQPIWDRVHYISGHITAVRLFVAFWRYNGQIIIIDDADSRIRDATAQNILKAALDDKPQRLVSYDSTFKLPAGVPSSFPFTGGVILITNDENFSGAAVKERSDYKQFNLTLDEIIDVISKQIIPNDYRNTTRKQREYLLKTMTTYAVQNGTEFTFRKYYQLLNHYIQNPSNLHLRLFELLGYGDEESKVFMEVYKKHKNAKRRQEEFCKRTGTSERHFYDVQKNMVEFIQLLEAAPKPSKESI